MSVQDFLDFQNHLLEELQSTKAWLLQANPVWGASETVNRIGLFDTKEAAEAYIKASKLPEAWSDEQKTTKDKYFRTFRPDSLLWDYNGTAWQGPMVVPAIPWSTYDGVAQNPCPPSGSCPPLDVLQEVNDDLITRHEQYGKDYDAGYGGPYSNMDKGEPRKPL